MKEIDVRKRTIGINFNEDNEAEIVVWSPTAEQIAIALDNEKINLSKKYLGYWTATTDKMKAGTQYKFLLNNKIQYPDPASLSQPNGVHQNSEAIDLKRFQWRE